MFSKTWRVHAIFTNIKLNKKVSWKFNVHSIGSNCVLVSNVQLIKDYKLFMVVAVLVFIDVATLTTWQIVDPFYRDTHNGTAQVGINYFITINRYITRVSMRKEQLLY